MGGDLVHFSVAAALPPFSFSFDLACCNSGETLALE
jgi:hypothetical protein